MIYPNNFEIKIGFNSVRELLTSECLSTLGKQKVEVMDFSPIYNVVERELNETEEFMRIIQEETNFPDQYFFDVRTSLKRIKVEGMYLEEEELFNLQRSLATITAIVQFLTRRKDDVEVEETEEEDDTNYPYRSEE